jgi:hypothetical protein
MSNKEGRCTSSGSLALCFRITLINWVCPISLVYVFPDLAAGTESLERCISLALSGHTGRVLLFLPLSNLRHSHSTPLVSTLTDP